MNELRRFYTRRLFFTLDKKKNMTKPDDTILHQQKNTLYLSGGTLPGIKFRYNSHVSFIEADGSVTEGWIVGVDPKEDEPIYTIECSDSSGDEEVAESEITLLSDPHDNTNNLV